MTPIKAALAICLVLATLAYAGLRKGEARGLQLEDVDLDGKKLHVRRQVYQVGGVGPPKRRKVRVVEMADDLRPILGEYLRERRAFDMRTGARSPWLFFPWFSPEPTRAQVMRADGQVRRAMIAVLDRAELPEHFTPHSLRHTYATLMLSRGENLLYVARQLGDTVRVTEEIYGSGAVIPASAGGPNLLSSRRKKEEEG